MHVSLPELTREAEHAFGRELDQREFERFVLTRHRALAAHLHELWHAYRAGKARLVCLTLQG